MFMLSQLMSLNKFSSPHSSSAWFSCKAQTEFAVDLDNEVFWSSLKQGLLLSGDGVWDQVNLSPGAGCFCFPYYNILNYRLNLNFSCFAQKFQDTLSLNLISKMVLK